MDLRRILFYFVSHLLATYVSGRDDIILIQVPAPVLAVPAMGTLASRLSGNLGNIRLGSPRWDSLWDQIQVGIHGSVPGVRRP